MVSKPLLLTALAPLLVACGHPKIDANCETNGFGMGRCDFTNEGNGSGTQCVVVTLVNKKGLGAPVSSSPVCSGDIKPHETRNVAFSLGGMGLLCSRTAAEAEAEGDTIRRSWSEYCDLHVDEQPH